jgi:hypothetical protein
VITVSLPTAMMKIGVIRGSIHSSFRALIITTVIATVPR